MKDGYKVVDIMPDGTLVVNTRHFDLVKRVVIKYTGKEPKTFLPKKEKKNENT